MREKFACDQKQGEDGCTELDPFLPALFSSERTHSPTSSRVPAHAFYVPKKHKIDYGPEPGKSQHRNSEPVGVQAGRWSCSGDGSKGGEPKSSAYPADKYCHSTHTLYYRKTERPNCKKPLSLPEPE